MDLTKANWRKASRSTSNGGNCVELAQLDKTIAIRDSKRPKSGYLALSPRVFRALSKDIKSL